MQLVLSQQVAHGEVVELDAHASDDTRLSPTERELQLVVRLLLQLPVNVHGSVVAVGLHVRVYLFSVEVAHLCDFTSRTHQGVF